MALTDDILRDIFGGERPALYGEFEGWLRGSRRFQGFAGDYRTKIRAKLRHAAGAEGRDDVRAELETAFYLLQEKSFTLAYEKYAAARQRGPDFTVTFKTHTPFNVEVRRLRALELDEAGSEARQGKLLAVLVDKARQMPPSIINLLWLAAGDSLPGDELAAAHVALLRLAERKDEAFFTRRGFASAAAFLKQYQRLSGIVYRQPTAFVVWPNPVARHPAPPAIVRAIEQVG